MIEIECPFCQASCRMDAADFSAASCSLACTACGISVEIASAGAAMALPLAA